MSESSNILNTVLGAAVGFAVAIFSEPLRQWIYRPKLKLVFDNDPGCRARTPERTEVNGSFFNADYIRIKVINTKSIAKKCRAYLVKIEKADDSGEFKPTIYSDSIPLSWACLDKEAYEPLDLPRDIVQFVDIVSTRSITNDFRPAIRSIPFRYNELFKERGKFRFTVLISGENVKPVFIKIVFSWSGVWDQYVTNLG